MLEIKPDRYFSAVWFVEGAAANWMAALYRDLGGPWTLLYRFRYFHDDKVQDSKDTRSWYQFTMDAATPEEKAARALDLMSQVIVAQLGSSLHKVELHTDDPDKVMEIWGREPWFSGRPATPEDAAKIAKALDLC